MLSSFDLGRLAAGEMVKEAIKSPARSANARTAMQKLDAANARLPQNKPWRKAQAAKAQAPAAVVPPAAPPAVPPAAALGGAAAAGAAPATFGAALSGSWKSSPLRALIYKHPMLASVLGIAGAGAAGLGAWNTLRTGSPLSHGADQYGLMDDPNISKMREAYMRGPEGQFGGLDPASGRWMQNALGAAGLRHRQVSNMFKAQREAFQD